MTVRPAGADWCDAAAYAAIRGRSDLAWEVLRRDPDYQSAFASIDRSRPASSDFVARWGLHFR